MSTLPPFPRAELDVWERAIERNEPIVNMFGLLSLIHAFRDALDEIDRLRAEINGVWDSEVRS